MRGGGKKVERGRRKARFFARTKFFLRNLVSSFSKHTMIRTKINRSFIQRISVSHHFIVCLVVVVVSLEKERVRVRVYIC